MEAIKETGYVIPNDDVLELDNGSKIEPRNANDIFNDLYENHREV